MFTFGHCMNQLSPQVGSRALVDWLDRGFWWLGWIQDFGCLVVSQVLVVWLDLGRTLVGSGTLFVWLDVRNLVVWLDRGTEHASLPRLSVSLLCRGNSRHWELSTGGGAATKIGISPPLASSSSCKQSRTVPPFVNAGKIGNFLCKRRRGQFQRKSLP